MSKEPAGLQCGERAPDFVLPLRNGVQTRFYARAGGKPTALFFYKDTEAGAFLQFAEALQEYSSREITVVAVRHEAENLISLQKSEPAPSFSDFLDAGGKVRLKYRLQPEAAALMFLLDANLRVLQSFKLDDIDTTCKEVEAITKTGVTQIEPKTNLTHAPVLQISNVLDENICEYLMRHWQHQGNVETGVEQSSAGQRQETFDGKKKRRRDHTVTDPELLKLLSATVGSRVMPEVQKAFSFRATRFEGFKITCYDAADNGVFHAHRDNLSPATAHRRFALTLNLNSDYEGGYLRFAEYAPHLYRPDAGSAVVFSCSHLHEVTEVTAGKRFTLLSFLFGEADVRSSGTRVAKQQTEGE